MKVGIRPNTDVTNLTKESIGGMVGIAVEGFKMQYGDKSKEELLPLIRRIAALDGTMITFMSRQLMEDEHRNDYRLPSEYNKEFDEEVVEAGYEQLVELSKVYINPKNLRTILSIEKLEANIDEVMENDAYWREIGYIVKSAFKIALKDNLGLLLDTKTGEIYANKDLSSIKRIASETELFSIVSWREHLSDKESKDDLHMVKKCRF